MKKLFLIIVSFVVLLLLIDYTACRLYSGKVADFFRERYVPESDTAVVFFGGFKKDFSDPDAETCKRLNHALDLYKTKKIKNIICAGGNINKGKFRIYGSVMMRIYLRTAGVPDENLFHETVSYDTFSNWEEARKIIISHNWKKVTFVSSSLHLYRIAAVITDDSLRLFYSPYASKYSKSIHEFWVERKKIHHEWLAFAALKIFPKPYYETIVRKIR